MSSDIQPYILDELDAVIDQTVADIGLYTKKPSDFTRNCKLNATTTIKVTLNMQGNSLNAELLDAFPNLDEHCVYNWCSDSFIGCSLLTIVSRERLENGFL